MDKNTLNIVKQLYKPTKECIQAVEKLDDLLKQKGDTIHFKQKYTIGELTVNFVERECSHCVVNVHWMPEMDISRIQDPFCSAFVLTSGEINKLIKHIEKNY